ncbi:MAG: hypothetical protein ACXQTA_01745, partial [Candidatus Syntropharchaeales archaeon]
STSSFALSRIPLASTFASFTDSSIIDLTLPRASSSTLRIISFASFPAFSTIAAASTFASSIRSSAFSSASFMDLSDSTTV